MLKSHEACHLLGEVPAVRESDRIALRARLLAAAHRHGFPAPARERMALACYELATNIVKHAEGRGLIQIWRQPGPTLDLFAVDRGPGIADLTQALRDGFSTRETFGKGLGSLERLSDHWAIYSIPRGRGDTPRRGWHGTAVLSRFSRSAAALPAGVGLFSRSLRDDRANGDRLFLEQGSRHTRWLHVDGLGSGARAQAASAPLDQALSTHTDPIQVLAGCDRLLGESGGRAVAAAGLMHHAGPELELAGVGDIHAHLIDGGAPQAEKRQLGFAPGILGAVHGRASTHRLELAAGSLVVSASDGIRGNWSLAELPRLSRHHPQLIAYLLGYQLGRLSDDQSLAVIAAGPEGPGTAADPTRKEGVKTYEPR